MSESKSSSLKLKWGIILIVWPVVALIASLIIYAISNWVFGASGGSVVTTIVNVLLFIVGAAAIALGGPSIVVGIVMLATRGGASSTNPSASQSSTSTGAHVVNGAPKKGKGMSIAGMVLGITSIVFIYLNFVLGVLAIIFSAIGLKRGEGKGMAIAGLVTGIVGVIIGLVLGIIVAFAAYAGVTQAANDTQVQTQAITTQTQAELFYTVNGSYPNLAEIRNEIAQEDSDIIIGSQGEESPEDIIYIPCYGDGAVIWYWDSEDEEYKTINVGATDYCEWE